MEREDDGSGPARSTASPVVRGSLRATAQRTCIDDVGVEGRREAEAAEDRREKGLVRMNNVPTRKKDGERCCPSRVLSSRRGKASDVKTTNWKENYER